MFLGGKIRKLILLMLKKDFIIEMFLEKVVFGYKCCGIYLQNKLLLDNKVFRSLRVLDLDVR